MAKVKDVLLELNPWWKGNFKIEFTEREVYSKIQKFIPLPQILAFTGLRRVGKTTLMYKIVEDALKSGFDPKRIVYFSFDEFREAELRDILREYESMTGIDFGKEKNCLLLLDEIQKLRGWADQLKAAYDRFGKNAKMVISGSESLFVRKMSRETLAGRMFEFMVEPLSFKEFLSFKGVDFKPTKLYEKELARLFREFVSTFGFPEMIDVKDKEVIAKYVKESIVEKVVYRDMPELFKIKDISVLASLLNIIMEEPGQLIEISELATELGISRQTVSTYLKYLEESFLIRKLYNFSRSRRKMERKLKKYYPTVVSPALMFRDDDVSKSRVFEWLMVNNLKAEFFWRDPYKNEVDIVMAGEGGRPLPVEIKYGKLDFGGMLAFLGRFSVSDGFLVSPDKEEKKTINSKTISVVPAFKFLLEKW